MTMVILLLRSRRRRSSSQRDGTESASTLDGVDWWLKWCIASISPCPPQVHFWPGSMVWSHWMDSRGGGRWMAKELKSRNCCPFFRINNIRKFVHSRCMVQCHCVSETRVYAHVVCHPLLCAAVSLTCDWLVESAFMLVYLYLYVHPLVS